MVRKVMTKEVTKTTVKLATLEIENGSPMAVTHPDEILLGNVSQEKAQKELNKKFGKAVTIFEVVPETETYEMEVEEFIKHATLKQPEVQETLDLA